MILSFHPLFIADKNLLCAGRDPGQTELTAIQKADAVVLPQGCRESLYRVARDNCAHVFPNYDARFNYPEKIGQARLFKVLKVPHPTTLAFEKGVTELNNDDGLPPALPMALPFVLKFNWGGEGKTVFPIETPEQFHTIIDQATQYEKSGQTGFLIQETIPCQGRSLRVVVINRTLTSYWRIQKNDQHFHTNLKQGARIDFELAPELQTTAQQATRVFCDQTGINLAGFDFLFSDEDLSSGRVLPLFLEINYFFGRRGLGGSDKYYQRLQDEIDIWLNNRIGNIP